MGRGRNIALTGLAIGVLVAACSVWRYWPIDYWRTTDNVPVALSPADAQAVAVAALSNYGGVPPGAGPPRIAEQTRVTFGWPHPVTSTPRVMEYVFIWSPSGDLAPRDVLYVSVDSYPIAHCNARPSLTSEREIRRTCDAYSVTFGATATSMRRRWVPGAWRAFEQWRARASARAVTIAGSIVDSCLDHSIDVDAFRRVVGASDTYAPAIGMGDDADASYVKRRQGAAIAELVPFTLSFPHAGNFVVTAAIVGDHGDGHYRDVFLKLQLRAGVPKRPAFVHVESADHEPICREHATQAAQVPSEGHTVADMQADAIARAREEIEDRRFMSSPNLPIIVQPRPITHAAQGFAIVIDATEGSTKWHDHFTYDSRGWLQRADFTVVPGAHPMNGWQEKA